MTFENLTYEKRGAIAVITLSRLKVLNALNRVMLRELSEAIDTAADDLSIRAVLLTGAGTRAFAAGADVGELAELSESSAVEYATWGQALLRRIETLGKPVIAVIFGFALGGGCELAMACTLRLASEDAQFGQPEVKLGVMAGFGGTQRLPRLVGRGTALKMLLSGELITAAEALRIGLVDEVLPSDTLMARAEELAHQIGENAPFAIRQTLLAVDSGLAMPFGDALALEVKLFGECCRTHDKDEGTAAFLAKRPAVWTGE